MQDRFCIPLHVYCCFCFVNVAKTICLNRVDEVCQLSTVFAAAPGHCYEVEPELFIIRTRYYSAGWSHMSRNRFVATCGM